MVITDDAPGGFIALSSDDEEGQVSSSVSIDQEVQSQLSPAELRQLRLYFPSATDPSNMCLSCGQPGHSTRVCSQQTNGATGSEANGSAQPCSFCASLEHGTARCAQNWRSYRPSSQNLLKVTYMAISCGACGSRKHFITDCESRKSFLNKNPTWSLQNREQYIDPKCSQLSIEETASSQQQQQPAVDNNRPNLKLRGKPARANNVHYSESDDSELEFIGTKVVRRPPPNQIRVASNIQLPPSATNGGRPKKKKKATQSTSSHNGDQQNNGPPSSWRNMPRRAPPPPPPAQPRRGGHGLPPKPVSDFRSVPPPPPEPRNQGTRDHQRGRGRGNRAARGRGRGRGRGG